MPDALISYPGTPEGLFAAIEALGTTPNAVATVLSGLGFRGETHSATDCPIACYIRDSLDGAKKVEVFLELEEMRPHVVVTRWGNVVVQADGTTAAAAFIRMFDASYYPDLIEEDSDATP